MASQILQGYNKSPRNVCYTCGSAQRQIGGRPESIVDWGIWIEMEGNLQQCETCITGAARKLGLLTEDQASDIQTKLFQAEAARARAENKITKLEAILTKLTEVEDESL